MPTMKFLKSEIDKLSFTEQGQVDYFDTETPGLGLRVGTKSKTFFVKTDVRDTSKPKGYRTVKKTIGRFGDFTLEEARARINGHSDKDKGFIPGVRLQLKQGPAASIGAEVTLQKMLSDYFTETKRKNGMERKGSTVTGYTGIIERHFSTWLPLPLSEIAKFTPDIVIDRHNQIKAAHGDFGARNAFVMLSPIINYSILKYPAAIAVNPFSVLGKAQILSKVKARDEKLEGNEFKIFHEGIQKFSEILRDCYLFCLYQGMRSEEAACLTWEQVNLEKKSIRVIDTKNRQDLYVPLSLQSLAILKQRKERNPEGNPWVFPSLNTQNTNKSGHVRLMAEPLRKNTGLKLTVHALRRSFITIGRRLKMFNDTDRLTNHIDSTVTGKHYDGTDIEDLRHPLQVIDNEIERLMLHGVGAKVIQFAAAQGE